MLYLLLKFIDGIMTGFYLLAGFIVLVSVLTIAYSLLKIKLEKQQGFHNESDIDHKN